MAEYNVVSVRRTPQSSGVPVYTELGPLYASALEVKDFKSLTPAECRVTVSMGSLDSDTKTSLLDLAAAPIEVWVYRDGTRIFAGPVVGGNVNQDTVTLNSRGRSIYMSYMLVWTDKSFTSIDLFTIAKELVDDWQALTYGNFGILTASIGTLGTTRSLEIPGASEFPRVLGVLQNLSQGAFEAWLDHDTGALEFAAARGTDLSASVALERGIVDAEAGFALGPGLLASEVYAAGTSPTAALVTSKSDATLRASFGRSGLGTNHDPVTDANHLSDLADADLAAVGTVYFSPGGEMFEVLEATYGNMEPGNTVEYSYDAGLGKQTANVRIEKRTISVAQDGQEKLAVEFE